MDTSLGIPVYSNCGVYLGDCLSTLNSLTEKEVIHRVCFPTRCGLIDLARINPHLSKLDLASYPFVCLLEDDDAPIIVRGDNVAGLLISDNRLLTLSAAVLGIQFIMENYSLFPHWKKGLSFLYHTPDRDGYNAFCERAHTIHYEHDSMIRHQYFDRRKEPTIIGRFL